MTIRPTHNALDQLRAQRLRSERPIITTLATLATKTTTLLQATLAKRTLTPRQALRKRGTHAAKPSAAN